MTLLPITPSSHFPIISEAWSATYYVDATNGNDANVGTSSATPWKSIKKVLNWNYRPGDEILFKRGESWFGCLDFNRPGTPDKPIKIGAYGTGQRPIIRAKGPISGFNALKNWTKLEGSPYSVFYMDCPDRPGRLWLSGIEYPKAQSLSDINSGARWWWGDVDGKMRLVVYSASNPALTYTSIEGLQTFERAVRIQYPAAYIVLENLDLRGGRYQVLCLQGASYVTIQDCYIGRDSIAGVEMNGNPWGEFQESNYGILRNCVIDSGYHFMTSFDSTYVRDGVFLYDGANYWEVYGNTIRDWHHNGITLQGYDGRFTNGASFNKVHNNTIRAENTAYCRGITTQGIEGKCQYNQIYGNLIKNTTVRNQINGNNNSVYYNVIDTVTNSPFSSSGSGTNGTAQGIDLQGYKPFVCHDNKILNNVIYNCDEAGLRLRDEYGPNPKRNNSVINNIVMNCGKKSKDGLMNYGIVIDSGSSVESNTFRNNCVYSGGVQNTIYYRGSALTVSQFNATNGQNGDVMMNNLGSDPIFSGIDQGMFLLQKNSPCIDASIDVGLQEDYRGLPVPVGSRVDIGAFEYSPSSFPPPSPPRNLRIIK